MLMDKKSKNAKKQEEKLRKKKKKEKFERINDNQGFLNEEYPITIGIPDSPISIKGGNSNNQFDEKTKEEARKIALEVMSCAIGNVLISPKILNEDTVVNKKKYNRIVGLILCAISNNIGDLGIILINEEKNLYLRQYFILSLVKTVSELIGIQELVPGSVTFTIKSDKIYAEKKGFFNKKSELLSRFESSAQAIWNTIRKANDEILNDKNDIHPQYLGIVAKVKIDILSSQKRAYILKAVEIILRACIYGNGDDIYSRNANDFSEETKFQLKKKLHEILEEIVITRISTRDDSTIIIEKLSNNAIKELIMILSSRITAGFGNHSSLIEEPISNIDFSIISGYDRISERFLIADLLNSRELIEFSKNNNDSNELSIERERSNSISN